MSCFPHAHLFFLDHLFYLMLHCKKSVVVILLTRSMPIRRNRSDRSTHHLHNAVSVKCLDTSPCPSLRLSHHTSIDVLEADDGVEGEELM